MSIDQIRDEFLKSILVREIRLVFLNHSNIQMEQPKEAWSVEIAIDIIREIGNSSHQEEYKSNNRKDDMFLLTTIRKHIEDKFCSHTETTYKDKKYIKLDHSIIDNLKKLGFEEHHGHSHGNEYKMYTLNLLNSNINDFFKVCQELLNIEPLVRVKKFKDMYE